jgi:mono/diheme cytochrome c family protein
MNLTKTVLLLSTLFVLPSTVSAKESGEALIKQNCATCHMLSVPKPEMIPTLKAPAMGAVLFHLKKAMNNDYNKSKAFILDYVQNPDVAKSVCESNKVAKFGVMPSQKGKVSEENLSIIADYMLENYPSKKFVKMITEILRNGKMNALKSSPFLMNQDALPHLTKILIENWDKGALGLTAEQKTKLLVVRKETMGGIKAIKMKLAPLESEIIEALVDEESLDVMKPKVEEVAKLKAQATMIHLKCLKDSVEILSDEQLEYLLPFWGV